MELGHECGGRTLEWQRQCQGQSIDSFINWDSTVGLAVPPEFEKRGSLIRFICLPVGDLKLYTVGFRISDQPNEKWTARFNRFKYGNPAATHAAIRTFCKGFDSLGYPQGHRVVVTAAIASHDTTVDADSPAAQLACALAQWSNWEWFPNLLAKVRHPKLSSLESAVERDSTVNGVYSAATIGGDSGVVLVVDDFCTRGATLTDIARAVRFSNPKWRVGAACLARTARADRYQPGLLTNNHIPDELDDAWREI